MFSTAHFFSTLILYLIIENITPLPPYSLTLMIILGLGLDGDILLKKDHRKMPTHSIFATLISIPFLILGIKYFLLILSTILMHLFLDSLDWNLYLFYPISKKPYGINLAQKNSNLEPKKDSTNDFIDHYFSNKKILVIESVLMAVGILLGANFLNLIQI